MRYTTSHDSALGETRIELASNSYTDAFPPLKRLLFRRQDIDVNAQALPLAAAILTSRYCSDQFEFTGARIGGDYAEAIRCIIGARANIAGVDGMQRALSLGETDMVMLKASASASGRSPDRRADAVPLVHVDWSGDFVESRSRSSAGYALGQVFTNAALFADETRVSVALGLLLGRDRLRTLYVPAPTDPDDIADVADALKIVSIGLEFMH